MNGTIPLDYLKQYANPVFGHPIDNQTSIDDQFAAWAVQVQSLQANNTSDWQQYCKAIHRLALSQSFFGQNYIPAAVENTVLQDFNNLVSDTSYIAIVYGDNLSGSSPSVSFASGTTFSAPSNAEFSISFSENLTDSQISQVAPSICSSLMISSARCALRNGYRRALSTSVMIEIYTDPSYWSPASVLASSVTPSSVQTAMANLGITVSMVKVSLPTTVKPEDYGIPGFADAVFHKSSGWVTFSWTSEVTGTVFCGWEPIIINSTTVALSADQLFFGADQNGVDYSQQTVNFTTVQGVDNEQAVYHVSGNEDYESYNFSCTVCNAYPGTPDCLANITWMAIDLKNNLAVKLLITFGAMLSL
jgi:hypothetical protein